MVKKKRGPAPTPPEQRSMGHIGVLVKEAEKAAWKEAARRDGISLSSWVANKVRAKFNDRSKAE